MGTCWATWKSSFGVWGFLGFHCNRLLRLFLAPEGTDMYPSRFFTSGWWCPFSKHRTTLLCIVSGPSELFKPYFCLPESYSLSKLPPTPAHGNFFEMSAAHTMQKVQSRKTFDQYSRTKSDFIFPGYLTRAREDWLVFPPWPLCRKVHQNRGT